MTPVMFLWPDRSLLIYNILFFILFICGCGFYDPSLSGFSPASSDLYAGGVIQDSKSSHKKPVDILIVMDTSYAMIAHLEQAPHTFKGFLQEWDNLDYRVFFTNADHDPSDVSYYRKGLLSGRLMPLERKGRVLKHKVLHPGFLDRDKIFIDTLKRYKTGSEPAHSKKNPCNLPPYCQSQVRNPVRSLVRSIEVNHKRFRESADFVGILFSNGDESDIYPEGPEILKKVFYKYNKMDKKLRIFGIAVYPNDENCLYQNKVYEPDFGAPAYSYSILSAVQATGGRMMSICASHFAGLAKFISTSIDAP